jgi:hypothetical protein
MDFDIKLFFKTPPRIKEDLKSHVHHIGEQIVDKCIHHLKQMGVERVVPKYVHMVFFHMAQEPFTRVTRNSLCIQQLKIKPVQKVFARVFHDCEQSESKNAGIDKKIIKYVSAKLSEHNLKFNPQAVVQIAACTGEICGILLNCTAVMMENEKTMTLKHFNDNSCTYCLSNGSKVLNHSLVRFLHYIKQPNPDCRTIDVSKKRKCAQTSAEAEKDARTYKPQRLETKQVSFTADCRPKTPTYCFWEED